jgi:hypothetical protein
MVLLSEDIEIVYSKGQLHMGVHRQRRVCALGLFLSNACRKGTSPDPEKEQRCAFH